MNPNPIVFGQAIDVVHTVSVTPEAALAVTFNEGAASELLIEHNFPQGLQDAFNTNLSRIPLRYFIIDDSGSMQHTDGSMTTTGSDGSKDVIACSRWSELTSAMKFHVKMARAAEAPSEFRLLNGAEPLKIGYGDADESNRLATLMAALDGSPGGGTPLCRHIGEVIEEIQLIESQLRSTGKKVCLVIATDGMASDGDVAQAMRPLKNLPVLVILRLCTNEEDVVEYWNGIDRDLELNIDVIDDQYGEAKELRSFNPWLTYGEQLHRLREFGNTLKEIDLLDERELSKEHLRKICCLIYGGKIEDYPHPELDFGAFEEYMKQKNASTKMVFDPISKKDRHWVDVGAMHSQYGPDGCCSIC